MIDVHSPYCCYFTGVVFYTCCNVNYALLTLKVPKEQMTKSSRKLSRLCHIENIQNRQQTM